VGLRARLIRSILRVSNAVISAGAVALQCDSACEDADEASGQWEVYGGPTGPFRMDSRVCKAALIAGVIDRDGGEVRAARTCMNDTNRGNKHTHSQ
jgi:hypothetical protein